MQNLIPLPASIAPSGEWFALTADATILLAGDENLARPVGAYLAALLAPATGYTLPVLTSAPTGAAPVIKLTLTGPDPDLGVEGYHLSISSHSVEITAAQPAGLFYGVQTLRQLLPAAIESSTPQDGPWQIPGGQISDHPRYPWRGMMLDVARHFFSVEDVKQVIDWLAYYKMNRLHLHLADDQGWRLEIKSWPNLTLTGGQSAVDGDPGGYYTQEQYAEIVAYAQSRFVIVVPEIDMPGHTNAALASYPELNCNGVAPDLYTGTEVGFSSLCTGKEITYQFLDDVIGEIADLTPGDYIHIGGDEAQSTSLEDYKPFIERVQQIVTAHGKTLVGWEEIAQAAIAQSSIPQVWNGKTIQQVIQRGNPVIFSLASRSYIDMKYDASTSLGLNWAGFIEVQDAYDWDPATQFPGLAEAQIAGVEAPLWSETLRSLADIQYMVFPRLPGIAEIGWSPAGSRAWSEYKVRLGYQASRWKVMGIRFYRSNQVKMAVRSR